MSKTLSVSAIQNGTVIDHIPVGQALKIIHLLKLLETNQCVTVGFRLLSRRMKLKDLIKIEDYVLTEEEANKITVFAQEATINVIKNFTVKELLEYPQVFVTLESQPEEIGRASCRERV